MGIFDKLFSGGGSGKKERLDVSSRFLVDRHAFTGTMSKFHVVKEIGSGDLYGIKFLDREKTEYFKARFKGCLLYTSPSPRDGLLSRMPSSA